MLSIVVVVHLQFIVKVKTDQQQGKHVFQYVSTP